MLVLSASRIEIPFLVWILKEPSSGPVTDIFDWFLAHIFKLLTSLSKERLLRLCEYPPPPHTHTHTHTYTHTQIHTTAEQRHSPTQRESRHTKNDLCGIKRITFLSSLLGEPFHHSTPTRMSSGTLRQEKNPSLDMLQWETCSDCSCRRYSCVM